MQRLRVRLTRRIYDETLGPGFGTRWSDKLCFMRKRLSYKSWGMAGQGPFQHPPAIRNVLYKSMQSNPRGQRLALHALESSFQIKRLVGEPGSNGQLRWLEHFSPSTYRYSSRVIPRQMRRVVPCSPFTSRYGSGSNDTSRHAWNSFRK